MPWTPSDHLSARRVEFDNFKQQADESLQAYLANMSRLFKRAKLVDQRYL